MKPLIGNLIVAVAILIAGLLIAYHPFQKTRPRTQPHFQFSVHGATLFQFDPSTGRVWMLSTKPLQWVMLPIPK